MRKKYNIFIISRLYVKNFYRFLVEETEIKTVKSGKRLFMWGIRKIYGMEATDWSRTIETYGEKCINFLKGIEGTPDNIEKLSFEDRSKVVSLCEAYWDIGFFTYSSIKAERVNK